LGVNLLKTIWGEKSRSLIGSAPKAVGGGQGARHEKNPKLFEIGVGGDNSTPSWGGSPGKKKKAENRPGGRRSGLVPLSSG